MVLKMTLAGILLIPRNFPHPCGAHEKILAQLIRSLHRYRRLMGWVRVPFKPDFFFGLPFYI